MTRHEEKNIITELTKAGAVVVKMTARQLGAFGIELQKEKHIKNTCIYIVPVKYSASNLTRTEKQYIYNCNKTIKTMKKLQALAFRYTQDDFGIVQLDNYCAFIKYVKYTRILKDVKKIY